MNILLLIVFISNPGLYDEIYPDYTYSIYGTATGDACFPDDYELAFGNCATGDFVLNWETSQTNNTMMFGVDAVSRSIIVCEHADISTDFTHAVSTNPIIFVQSADATDVDQWISISHNQTNGLITTGKGLVNLGTAAATGHSLTAGATIIGGALEVDGTAYLDGDTILNNVTLLDTKIFYFGSSTAADASQIEPNVSLGQLLFALDDNLGRQIVVGGDGLTTKDFDHATPTNPTVFIHSAVDPDSDNTEWVSISHNQTNGFITTGKGPLALGTSAATGHSLTAGDALIGGKLEVDGQAFFDGNLYTYGTVSLGLSDSKIYLGSDSASSAAMLLPNRLTFAQLGLLLHDDLGLQLVIGNSAYYTHDFDHAVQTNPTLFIHSDVDPDSDNTQWIGLYHNQTAARIESGSGVINIGTAAATGHSMTTGDVLFGGKAEFDNYVYIDGSLVVFSTKNMLLGSNVAADASTLVPNNTQAQLALTLDDSQGLQLVIGGNFPTKDFDHAVGTDPAVYIHSAIDPDSDNTQWLKFSHNQTAARIESGLGPINIGKAAVTGHSLTSDDVIFGNLVEIDATLFLDGNAVVAPTKGMYFGSSSGAGATVVWSNTTMAQFGIQVDDSEGRQIVIGGDGTNGKDFDHDLATNPILYIHSVTDPDSANDEWVSISHNQTSPRIASGKGPINLGTVATTSRAIGNGDTLIGGKLEIDGNIYTDAITYHYGSVISNDDVRTNFGINSDYWFEYNDTRKAFELWTSDGDLSGTDTKLMSVADGTSAIDFLARLYKSTAALNLGTAATTNRGLATGDIIFGGKIEVEGNFYFEAEGYHYAAATWANNAPIYLGGDKDFAFYYDANAPSGFKFITSDGDGVGTNADIMFIKDGTKTLVMQGNLQLPKIINAAPAEPVVCSADTAGVTVYVDDNDDTATAEVCICLCTDDSTYDWKQMSDPDTACSFF